MMREARIFTINRLVAIGLVALVAVALLAAGGLAQHAIATHPGTTVLVDAADGTGDGGGCGDVANPCDTIQTGIDHAAAGDTVSVAAGTYAVASVINVNVANLTISGDKGSTFVDGSGKNGIIVNGQDVLFNVSASGVTIENLTIDLGDGDDDFDVGIFTPNDASVDTLTVRNNTMRFAAFGAPAGAGEQLIHLGGGTGNTVDDNDLETASSNSTIYVGDNTNVALTIQDNTIAPDSDADGGGTAINSFGPVTATSTISGNTFTKTGIAVWLGADQLSSGTATDGVDVTGNTFTDTTSATYGAVVIAAEVDGVATSNISVTRNSFSGGAGDGVLVWDLGATADLDASTVNINCNNFNGTNGAGVTLDSVSGTVNALFNWWGAADGPSGAGAGSGDIVSANVDFDPFLMAPGCDSIIKVPRLANLWLCNDDPVCDSRTDQGVGGVNFDVRFDGHIDTPDPKSGETQQIGSFEFEIRYDAKYVTVTVEPGDIFIYGNCVNEINSSGSAGSLECVPPDASCATATGEGYLQFACVTKGKPYSAASGPGTLAVVHVRPTADVYKLLIPNQENGIVTQLINQGCQLSDLQGHPIKTDLCENAAITIRYLEGDVHADCVIDVMDQQQIAFRWGAQLGNLLYDARYDLEPSFPQADGDIDAKDLQFVYGRHTTDTSTCKDPHPPQPPVDPQVKIDPPVNGI